MIGAFNPQLFQYGLNSYPQQMQTPAVTPMYDMFGVNPQYGNQPADAEDTTGADQNALSRMYVDKFNNTADNYLRHYLRSGNAFAQNAQAANQWLQNRNQVVGSVPQNSTTDTPGRAITADERIMNPLRPGDPQVDQQMIAANPGLAPKAVETPMASAKEPDEYTKWKQAWSMWSNQPRYGVSYMGSDGGGNGGSDE